MFPKQITVPDNSLITPMDSSSPTASNGSDGMKCSPGFNMNEEERKTRDKCLYLKQLLQDKKQLQNLPGVFLHLDRVLDEGQ